MTDGATATNAAAAVKPLERLVLGTAQLGSAYGIANRTGMPPPNVAEDILVRAYAAGVRSIDTAGAYGESERIIGAFHEHHPECRFDVISKIDSGISSTGPQAVIAAVKQSRNRVAQPLAGILLHDAADLRAWDDGLGDALRQCIDDGLAATLGVSVYTPEAFEAALAIDDIRIIQAPFNVADRRIEQRGLLAKAEERGKQVYVRSAFLQGLLLLSPKGLPAGMGFAVKYVERWQDLCDRWRLPPDEAALKFVAAESRHARMVLGCETVAQLNRNIEILNGAPLPAGCIDDIRALAQGDERLVDPSLWPEHRTA